MNIPTKHLPVARQLVELGTASPEDRRAAHERQRISGDTAAQESSAIAKRMESVTRAQSQQRGIGASGASGSPIGHRQQQMSSGGGASLMDIAGASPTAVLANLGSSERNKAAVRHLHDSLFEHARVTVLQRRRDNSGPELNKLLKALLRSFKDDPRLVQQRAGKGVPSVMIPTLDDVIAALSDERFELAKTGDSDFQDHIAKRMQWLIGELGHAREAAETWEEQYKLLLIEYATAEEAMNTAIAKQSEAEEYLRGSVATLAQERSANRTMISELHAQIAQLREKLYATLESQAGLGPSPTPASPAGARLPPVRNARTLGPGAAKDDAAKTAGKKARVGGDGPAATPPPPPQLSDGASDPASLQPSSPFEEKETLLRQLVALRQERDELKRSVSVLEDKVLIAQRETAEQEAAVEQTLRSGTMEASNLHRIIAELRDAHTKQLRGLEAENVKAQLQIREYERSIADLQQQLRESAVRMLSLQNVMLSGPSVQTLLFDAVSAETADEAREGIEDLTAKISEFADRFSTLRGGELPGVLRETRTAIENEVSTASAVAAETVESARAGSPMGLPRKSMRRSRKSLVTSCSAVIDRRDAATNTDAPLQQPSNGAPLGALEIARSASPITAADLPRGESVAPAVSATVAASLSTSQRDSSPVAPAALSRSASMVHFASPLLQSTMNGGSDGGGGGPHAGTPTIASRGASPVGEPAATAPTAAMMTTPSRAMSPAAPCESDLLAAASLGAPPVSPPAAAAAPLTATPASRPATRQAATGIAPSPSVAKAAPKSTARGGTTASPTPSSKKKQSPSSPTAAPSAASATTGSSGMSAATAAPQVAATSGAPTGLTPEAIEIQRLQSLLERERRNHAIATSLSSDSSLSTAADFEIFNKLRDATAEAGRLRDQLATARQRCDELEAEQRALKGRITALEEEKSTSTDKAQVARLTKQLTTEREKLMKANEKYNQCFLASAALQEQLERANAEHAEEVEGLHQLLVDLRHEVQQLSKAEQRLHFISKEKSFAESCERAIRCITSAQAALACGACLEVVTNPLVLFPCGHVVCEKCFLQKQIEKGIQLPTDVEAAALQLTAHHARIAAYARHVSISGPKPQLSREPLIQKPAVRAGMGHPLHCEECDAARVVGFTRVEKMSEVAQKFEYLQSSVSEIRDVMMQSLAEDTGDVLRQADAANGRMKRRGKLKLSLGDTSSLTHAIPGAAVDLEKPPAAFIDD